METDNVIEASLLNGNNKGFCGMENVSNQSAGCMEEGWESCLKPKLEETSITREEPAIKSAE